MESAVSQLATLLHVALAMLLGGCLGWERERARRPAGLRTHMLVAGAAALFVASGDTLIAGFDRELKGASVQTDPLRIIEAVIAGVSFLGAGTILRRERSERVEGLTTAASLLATAGIAVCIAISAFVLALGATALTFLTLRVLAGVEGRMKPAPA
jgi:putative Mg2+ transporter-C (MgtC) family protein